MPAKIVKAMPKRAARVAKPVSIRKNKPSIRRATPRPGTLTNQPLGKASSMAPSELLAMQGMIGNRAVGRMIQRAKKTEATLNAIESGTVSNSFQQRLQRSQGSGKPLPTQTRKQMSPYFGNLQGVRLHTGREAVQMNHEIGAEAFTHGRDIYMGASNFNPNSTSGKRLLTHELTHYKQQTGGQGKSLQRKSKGVQIKQTAPAGLISRKKKKLHLDFVRMKRDEARIGKVILKKLGLAQHSGGYGHYWTEIGDLAADGSWEPQESYGWWPNDALSVKETFKGVLGQLNRGESNDPHHGDDAGKEFHPVMEIDDNADYDTIRSQVVSDIRDFAYGFRGKWKWRLGWGKNCQTFQKRLKSAVGLHNQKGKGWFSKPNDVETFKDQEEAKEATETADFNQNYEGVDYELDVWLNAGENHNVTGLELAEGTIVRLADQQLRGVMSDGYTPTEYDRVKIFVQQRGGRVWELYANYKDFTDSASLAQDNQANARATWEGNNPGTDYTLNNAMSVGKNFATNGESLDAGTEVRLVDLQMFGTIGVNDYVPNDIDIIAFYAHVNGRPEQFFTYYDSFMNNVADGNVEESDSEQSE